MSRFLQASLSARARFLLTRDGHDSYISGVHLGRELVLPELYLSLDDKGTLSIEYNSVESQTIFMESGLRTIISTSAPDVLRSVLTILGRYTVLDDLSAV